jgi:hypothetical protein
MITIITLSHFQSFNRGFSFPSLRDRQNTLVIRTLLAMMASLDEVTRKLMKKFEIEQAQNCGIEYRERDLESTWGFLNCAASYDQIGVNPDLLTQSIFPRAFKAHQEDQISFWVHNGEQSFTHCIAEPFSQSMISNPAMWITQSVRRPLYRKNFRDRHAMASAYAALEDNSASKHMFSSATSRYEDRGMQYMSHSNWLVEQWTEMMQWKSVGYEGLDRDACPPEWKETMGGLEGRTRGVMMLKLRECQVNPSIVEALRLDRQEAIPRLQEDLALPVDAYHRPEAPWL